jgi:hypothetical protein
MTDGNGSVAVPGIDIYQAKRATVKEGDLTRYEVWIMLKWKGDPIVLDLRPEVISNQPTWVTDGRKGADQCIADIEPIIGKMPDAVGVFPTAKNSIEYDGGQLQLVGDQLAPGNDYYYGTDGSGNKGMHPLPIGAAIDGLTGDVSATGPGTVAATINPNVVGNTKLADMAQARFKLRAAGAGTGDPIDGTPNEASTILDGATDPFLRTSALPPIPTLTPNTNVVYVSKVGNNANSGLTVALPKLTINAALTAAAALPSPRAVAVLDGAEYTEDLTIGVTSVFAPMATLIGRAILSTNAMLVVKNHYPAIEGSIAVDADNATGYAYYICADKLDARGRAGTFTACDAVRNIYNGMVLHVKCPVIIGSQTAVNAANNTTGHIHLDVSDVYCTGSGNVGLYAYDVTGVGGRIYGKVDHIINIAGATGSVGVWTVNANSLISITANEINTNTAYDCALGSLYLVCPRIIGTRTGTPVFEVSTHNVTGTQPLDADLTAIAALTPANDDILQRKAGAWTNRTIAQLLTDLGLGAIYQPLDATLTALAGLDTTPGLVEQTGPDAFTKRAIGAAASTDILSRSDGDGRYVEKSTFDAKGDLITASADNTPFRLQAGTDGSVLRSDSTATGGLSYGFTGIHVPHVPPSGSYVIPSVASLALATIAGAAGRIDFYPFVPAKTFTIDRLALEVTTLIAASQLKIGIYSDLAGIPDALLLGTGNLDGASTGVKFEAAAFTFVAGTPYWLAVHFSATTTVRGIAVGGLIQLAYPAAGGTALSTVRRATVTYASGLPNPAPAATLNGATAPNVMLRVA